MVQRWGYVRMPDVYRIDFCGVSVDVPIILLIICLTLKHNKTTMPALCDFNFNSERKYAHFHQRIIKTILFEYAGTTLFEKQIALHCHGAKNVM